LNHVLLTTLSIDCGCADAQGGLFLAGGIASSSSFRFADGLRLPAGRLRAKFGGKMIQDGDAS